LINEFNSQLIALMIRDPIIAYPNPSTSNPLIKPDAICSNSALITKVKKPRVNILMGRVRIIKTC